MLITKCIHLWMECTQLVMCVMLTGPSLSSGYRFVTMKSARNRSCKATISKKKRFAVMHGIFFKLCRNSAWVNCLFFPLLYVMFIVPRHGEAIGGDIEMLGVRLCVCPSVRVSITKRDNFRFHAPIYTIFDPVMHPTIALDDFEDE